MSWHYRAKRVKEDFGGGYEYTIVEAFPGLESEVDDVVPHTGHAKFYGETPEDLAKWLRQAADDVERYDVINNYQENKKED